MNLQPLLYTSNGASVWLFPGSHAEATPHDARRAQPRSTERARLHVRSAFKRRGPAVSLCRVLDASTTASSPLFIRIDSEPQKDALVAV
jgi:hypothetical protein